MLWKPPSSRKLESGYELSEASGDRIQIYQSWELIAEMFRKSDYSDEYIDLRKTEVDTAGSAKIDETDD